MTQGQPDMSACAFAYDAPFTPARPRKTRRNRTGRQPAPADPRAALERTRQELCAGAWADECQGYLQDALHALAVTPAPAPRVLCLGLGSPCASRDARAQLAWLLEACARLALEPAAIAAYDPVFSAADDALLAAVQVQRLGDGENKCAAYELDSPTLVYMPHCDLQLYENLLRANWTRARLARLVLIANRLSEYLDSTPSHKLHAAHPCVARLAPLLTAHAFPPCAAHPAAFNNLAVQFARAGALPGADDAGFWALPPPRPLQPASAGAGAGEDRSIATS